MKLSEAIRFAAMLKPQAFNGRGDNKDDAACALRGAAEVLGIAMLPFDVQLSVVDYDEIRMRYPFMAERSVDCPMPECNATSRHGDLLCLVWHLNDWHCWTRERIADFVELHESLPVTEVEVSDEVEAGKRV